MFSQRRVCPKDAGQTGSQWTGWWSKPSKEQILTGKWGFTKITWTATDACGSWPQKWAFASQGWWDDFWVVKSKKQVRDRWAYWCHLLNISGVPATRDDQNYWITKVINIATGKWTQKERWIKLISAREKNCLTSEPHCTVIIFLQDGTRKVDSGDECQRGGKSATG